MMFAKCPWLVVVDAILCRVWKRDFPKIFGPFSLVLLLLNFSGHASGFTPIDNR